MKRYMLDTSIVTHLLKNHTNIIQRIRTIPISSTCISAITEGELLLGLAKRPEAKKLHKLLHEFLLCVDTLPWNNSVTKIYGDLRADLERSGHSLAPLDLLIAAHALASNCILVTNDQTFFRIPTLRIENWTK